MNHQSQKLTVSKSRARVTAPFCATKPLLPQNITNTGCDLVSLFECLACEDYALPPIYQCDAGHIVCATCRVQLQLCPACRSPFGNRNLAMEKVSEQVQFPCKYSPAGCMTTMTSVEKLQHEQICDYRPYTCPCPGAQCKWVGSIGEVMQHLVSQHNSITTLQGEDIVFMATDITLPGSVDWVMLQSCYEANFLLVLEKQDMADGSLMYFAVVQLIGTRKQAENFGCRLELRKGRRRLMWESNPRSIKDGIQSVILSSECLMFNGQTADMFSDNGNLAINVTVSAC